MISPVSSATAAPLRALFFSSAAPIAPVAPVSREQQSSEQSQNSLPPSVESSPPLGLKPPASPDTGIAAQESGAEGAAASSGDEELTQEEQAQVAKLQARDREVRAHEQAHAAAGGAQAGAPSYTYEKGPDGKQYAVGGEVPIKASASSNDPRAAIQQLEQVVRAALAPAQPSGQDRAVAAGAQAQLAQLRVQAAKESQEKAQAALNPGEGEDSKTSGATGTSGGESDSALPGLPKIGGSGPSNPGATPTALSGPITAYQQAGNSNDSRKAGGLLSLVA